VYVYMVEIRVYIVCNMCLSGCNGIYKIYIELQWRLSKVKSYGGVSQIAGNCNSFYPIYLLYTKSTIRGSKIETLR
jgi:hypothetical protein